MNETLGACYKLDPDIDKMTWAEADLFCAKNFGARSASVTSPEEREFIRTLTGNDKSWWTSGNDLGTVNKFAWADSGKLMTEGASSLGKNAPNQRCVKLREATLKPEATPCNEMHNVICKTLI
ncbi:lithostathine-1-like [Lingula anatina]|uniref:Lithostathine-1-like n=1 Tax=Lingula anatina TaxID=7574 RepID=A0A1S3J7W8_LINAN|nr:lithostathine-1-like [Lingula anatina]|eukprot:XP_013406326.1 lithostathine-1-like [Lingula anatina]